MLVRRMIFGFLAFSRMREFFHPFAPARTNFCGISSSRKASISISRFFLGSIVPRYRKYGSLKYGFAEV